MVGAGPWAPPRGGPGERGGGRGSRGSGRPGEPRGAGLGAPGSHGGVAALGEDAQREVGLVAGAGGAGHH